MRRIFIIRKDLHLSPGKLAAQVGHAAELYWLNILKNGGSYEHYGNNGRDEEPSAENFEFSLPYAVWTDYINGIYTKTICESRNLSHLLKAKAIADELGLKENVDYGFINDKCLTELKPENKDETTTVGMWFAPLDDEVAHKISKKYPLLRDHSEHSEDTNTHINFPLPKKWSIRYHRIGEPMHQTFCGMYISELDAINNLLQQESDIPAGMIMIDYLMEEGTVQRTEAERIRRFQEICKQSEGGLQTFK